MVFISRISLVISPCKSLIDGWLLARVASIENEKAAIVEFGEFSFADFRHILCAETSEYAIETHCVIYN